MKRFCKRISDYMGVLVLLAAVAAMLWPEVFSHLKPTLISPLLGVIMFGMGLTLRWEDFRVVFSRPRDVIIGCLAQFTVMPLLAWGLARLFQLDEALALGVVLVGCCPGGYRFSDFMRIGLLMNIIILAANIFIVNIVYPLTPLQ